MKSTSAQRSWYWYDWANSAYVTTTSTVLIGPYLTYVARSAACPRMGPDETCAATLNVLGLSIAPGSLVPYTVTASTIISAVVLLVIGAVVDQLRHPARVLGLFALGGAAAASGLFFVAGTNWQLGVALVIIANLCLGASLIVYDAMLVKTAAPDERDRVSSSGWALGYLGGGLLLAANLYLVSALPFSMSTDEAVRVSMLSAGLWWGTFTLIPVLGLRRVTLRSQSSAVPVGVAVRGSLRQLRSTLGHLRGYPQTWKFLVAYLFFNDGIQTVISSASLYGSEELHFGESQLIVTILLVQFVAFGGALLFGRLAQRLGAQRAILLSLLLWTAVVLIAFVMPSRQFALWLGLAVGIGLVLGGSQALSRSLFSRLIPHGREAEYFSLYQAMERGTSWFGTLAFGVVHQLTGSYRLSIVALMIFFVVGGLLLRSVNVAAGERAVTPA